MKYSEEQVEHYNFYVDNCTDGEIPISLELWVSEYWADVMDKLTAKKQAAKSATCTRQDISGRLNQ